MKASPHPLVTGWMMTRREYDLMLSVVTIMEVRRGIEMMPAGKRRQRLERWLTEDVPARFMGRILGIDAQTADICGTLLGRHHLNINVRRIMDVWLAAIAHQHGLMVVTRNERDFQDLGIRTLNPWTERAGS